jgi:hypothetical protein
MPNKPNVLYIMVDDNTDNETNEPFEPESVIDDEGNILENMYDQLLTAELILPQRGPNENWSCRWL